MSTHDTKHNKKKYIINIFCGPMYIINMTTNIRIFDLRLKRLIITNKHYLQQDYTKIYTISFDQKQQNIKLTKYVNDSNLALQNKHLGVLINDDFEYDAIHNPNELFNLVNKLL